MVRLVPMNESEFQAYQQAAIARSASDHVKAGEWMAGNALRLAEQEFQYRLPEGLASPNQYLLMIEDEMFGMKVGMLWFAVRDEGVGRQAEIYDLYICEEFRRRHYATHAFRAMETYVRGLKLTTISVQVFGENLATRVMYEKLGYRVTHVLMSKTLGRPGG